MNRGILLALLLVFFTEWGILERTIQQTLEKEGGVSRYFQKISVLNTRKTR